jgi:hypothetical protein
MLGVKIIFIYVLRYSLNIVGMRCDGAINLLIQSLENLHLRKGMKVGFGVWCSAMQFVVFLK